MCSRQPSAQCPSPGAGPQHPRLATSGAMSRRSSGPASLCTLDYCRHGVTSPESLTPYPVLCPQHQPAWHPGTLGLSPPGTLPEHPEAREGVPDVRLYPQGSATKVGDNPAGAVMGLGKRFSPRECGL